MVPKINKILLLSYTQSSQSNMLKPEMALEYTYDVNKHQEGCIIITKRIVTHISFKNSYICDII